LNLYDPDRSQTVTLLGQTSTWDAALGQIPVHGVQSIRAAAAEQRAHAGRGLRLLTETVISPSLRDQIRQLQAVFPEARWHQYEPVNNDAMLRAARSAYGEYVSTIYDFQKADVVLSLDADFLNGMPGSLRYAADFMSRRRVRTTEASASQAQMNRLYVV